MFALFAFAMLAPGIAMSAAPVVKTVPWVATNPVIPHDTWSGKPTRLKGTSDVMGANIQYLWDFGDGSPVQSGTVTNPYNIEALHTYTGSVGTLFIARLTVSNTSTGESASAPYFVEIRGQSLDVEANVAIDEGLWYLHKSLSRSGPFGSWGGPWVGSGYYAATANNVTAFLANGHLESGSPENPYTETVQRAMRQVFQTLGVFAISTSKSSPLGTYTVDTNGNGLGVFPYQNNSFYQSGMFMNAIVATGTPNAVATTGPANVIGRTYKAILQDMADFIFYCQYTAAPAYGGWRYNCGDFPDGSVAQWVAIGLIGAERAFGITVPPLVKANSKNWLTYSHSPATGTYGYTGVDTAWGPFATTPSGLVQNAMVGQGRGNPQWDRAETFLRDNFCNLGSPYTSIKGYYYGLFSFTKAMLLHDSNADGVAEPLTLLRSGTAGVTPIDWYAAETSSGAPCNGVARTLINDQNVNGYWFGHNVTSDQSVFETGWAILMLNRSVFESGNPVAVATATPNPAIAGQVIQLDGSASFHQSPGKHIDSWEWDRNNDGVFEVSGPFSTVSFPAVGDYPVKLRVSDDGSPEQFATTTITIRVSTPPLAPTANAGGPYSFCPNRTPYFLDGTGSVNPDDGQSEPGQPGDAIVEYAWDLDNDLDFNDVFGAQPDVTARFSGLAAGSYLVQLRVKDRTSVSFPSSTFGDLSDTDSAQVTVRASTDPACSCISNLAARPKLSKVQLTWTPLAGLPVGGKYNVYRGTVSGGPYLKIAQTTSTYSTYLDNGPLALGATYYYVVRPANAASEEICQSNQASARPVAR